jgi:hypothetical protein
VEAGAQVEEFSGQTCAEGDSEPDWAIVRRSFNEYGPVVLPSLFESQ